MTIFSKNLGGHGSFAPLATPMCGGGHGTVASHLHTLVLLQ